MWRDDDNEQHGDVEYEYVIASHGLLSFSSFSVDRLHNSLTFELS